MELGNNSLKPLSSEHAGPLTLEDRKKAMDPIDYFHFRLASEGLTDEEIKLIGDTKRKLSKKSVLALGRPIPFTHDMADVLVNSKGDVPEDLMASWIQDAKEQKNKNNSPTPYINGINFNELEKRVPVVPMKGSEPESDENS